MKRLRTGRDYNKKKMTNKHIQSIVRLNKQNIDHMQLLITKLKVLICFRKIKKEIYVCAVTNFFFFLNNIP